jgi:uncharacterized membrane protein
MNRRMKLIFTLSVLLNIVFVGVGVGMFYRFCQEIPIPGQMSPEARHFIARTFQEGRKEIKPLIDEVKADRAKVEKVLTAETFDAKAYDKTVDEMLDSRAAITRKRAEIMGRALADLPAGDRQKFAKRVLDGLEGHKPRRGGYHRKMMKDGEKEEERPSGEGR